jgi:hypothetical protein
MLLIRSPAGVSNLEMNNSPARPAVGGACISFLIGPICILARAVGFRGYPLLSCHY